MKTVAQEYVEKARQGWWKALLYKGCAIIQQTYKNSERKYSVYDINGEFIAMARTQNIAKEYIDEYINE